jgi:hypothetical protein
MARSANCIEAILGGRLRQVSNQDINLEGEREDINVNTRTRTSIHTKPEYYSRPGLFRDRQEAGCLLAAKLTAYANRPDVTVLALPRGGAAPSRSRRPNQ